MVRPYFDVVSSLSDDGQARYRWRTSTTDPAPYNPPARRSMTNTPQDPRPRPLKRSQTTPPKSFLQHPRGRPITKEISSPTPPPMATRSRTLSGRSKDIRIPSPIPEMPTPPVTICHKASVISQASVYSQASAPSHPGPASEFYPNTVQTQPVAMATPIHEVTPVVEAESVPVPQVDSGPQWPPKGWTIYILALSIDPSSSVERPNLMEYLFDQDTLTFFHPSTIRTSHLPQPSSSKREGAAALIAECRRDSIPDEPEAASPQSWLPLEAEVPLKSAVPFPSSPKGASSSVVNIPPIPQAPETAPPPRPRTPSRLKKKRKPGQGNSNRSSQSS
jgi:hypothetical protein